MSRLRNAKLVYKYQDDDTVIRNSKFSSFINKIIKHIRKYRNTGEQSRIEHINEYIKDLSINVLISQILPPRRTKGQFITEIVKSGWYIINHHTKTHCVSDCIAIAQVLAEKHNIQQGATIEQLKQLSDEYQIDIVFDIYEDKEMLDLDCYLIVQYDHCVIAFNPDNPRSQVIYDLSEKFNKEQQKLMKEWKPNNKLIHLVAYDFEWVCKGYEQIPYGYGLYQEDLDYHYKDCLDHANIYKSYCDDLFTLANEYIKTDHEYQFIPNKDGETVRNKEKLIISLCAHNGHKTDYPLIEKAIFNNPRFLLVGQCASRMAKISYTYQVICDVENVFVQFVDSMNFFL